MRIIGAKEVVFITISQNVPLMGKTWWLLMLALRSFLLLLAGFTLFSDEQERFVCNTIQPGCSNVCFDLFAPVSVLRLWLVHLLLLCLPHLMFATYIVHRVLSDPYFGSLDIETPFSLETSSKEVFLPKASTGPPPPRHIQALRFHCAYFCVVIVRILLEASFGAAQYFLVGLTIPKSFFCYEAPCTSGVECYVSRPTEKTIMLNFMLGFASFSVLLSLMDLISSLKATMRWRRRKERLMEEMNKGEQSSVFTTTTVTDDSQDNFTRTPLKTNGKAARIDPIHSKVNGAATLTPHNKDGKGDSGWSTAISTPVPHSHSRPPLSNRPDRRTVQHPTPTGANTPGQQSDSSECPDKRAWV